MGHNGGRGRLIGVVLAVLGGLLVLPSGPALAVPPVTWTWPPVVVDLPPSEGNRTTNYLDSASAADGKKVVAVWQSSISKAFPPADKTVWAATSLDAGRTWSDPYAMPGPEGTTGNWAEMPHVAVSADGTKATAVWYSQDGFFATYRVVMASTGTFTGSGITWADPEPLSAAIPLDADSGFAYDPQVTSSSNGSTVTAAWWGFDDDSRMRVYTRTTTDGGSSWDPADLVSGTDMSSMDPQVAASSDGSTVTVAWIDLTGGTDQVVAATRVGTSGSWTQHTLSAGSTDVFGIRVASSADGTKATAVWAEEGVDGYYAKASSRASAGGTWTAAQNLSAAMYYGPNPQVTSSADGSKLTALWNQYDQTQSVILSSTSANGGVNWSNPVPLSPSGENGVDPRLAGSSDGSRLTAFWGQWDEEWMEGDMQASSSTDGGSTWSTPQAVSTPGSPFPGQVTSSAAGTSMTAVWIADDYSVGRTVEAATGTGTSTGPTGLMVRWVPGTIMSRWNPVAGAGKYKVTLTLQPRGGTATTRTATTTDTRRSWPLKPAPGTGYTVCVRAYQAGSWGSQSCKSSTVGTPGRRGSDKRLPALSGTSKAAIH